MAQDRASKIVAIFVAKLAGLHIINPVKCGNKTNRNRLGFGSPGEQSPCVATRRVENLSGFFSFRTRRKSLSACERWQDAGRWQHCRAKLELSKTFWLALNTAHRRILRGNCGLFGGLPTGSVPVESKDARPRAGESAH